MLEGHRHGLRTVHEETQVMAALEHAWALLGQAKQRQMMLLTPEHPQPEDLDCLRAWVQGCVTAVHKALSLEALTVHSDERVHVEQVAAKIARVVDAFHIYAGMLERFRQADEMELPQLRPLAAVAEDERVLLACRVAVRRSLQQLFAAL
jgi:hypothetical protein